MSGTLHTLSACVPLAGAEVGIYVARGMKAPAEVKAETGADYVVNGGLYDMARQTAVCHLKAGGTVCAEDPYRYWGYAWDTGPDLAMALIPDAAKRNYICCVALIRDGEAEALHYGADLGGSRARTAMGIRDGCLCLFCTDTGMTPEDLQRELLAAGWDSALMLDGGGSSQCDFPDGTITSTRKVHNYIWVKAKNKEDKPVSKKIVCLDPGHGPDTVNGSPDGTYKEKEFTWDLYTRLRPILERQGVTVLCTRTQDTKPSLSARCKVSNDAKADLFVSLHTNAAGNGGWYDAHGLMVYTSAAGDTAGRNLCARAILARMRAAGVVLNGAGLAHQIEYTVLRDTDAPAVLIEYGFHTNRDDVALLKDGAYRDKLALATAKGICDYLGVAWTDADPAAPAVNAELFAAVDKLAAAGIISATDYWKGGDYSAANVQALLVAVAAKL